jgi:hypothetical protein
MSKYDDLVSKLREVFQIDRPELDFGIYRILNARAGEINNYLQNRLAEKVQQALSAGSATSAQQLQAELHEAEKSAQALGVSPDTVPKVQELRAKLKDATTGSSEHENAVFSHLLAFFSRYYKDGDFISQRRYKGDTYAIPYAGEEVMLHWANKDQYYTKSGENFSNYSFKLEDGRTVHFRLAAADTAKDNRKDNDKERRFALVTTKTVTRVDESGDEVEEELAPVEEVSGSDGNHELIIRFEYAAQPKGTNQEALVTKAVEAVLADAAVKVRWLALGNRAPTEKNPQRTLLEKHLSDYTTKNSADYFIHKDLGGFLRRELDFYIKNEVMHLDDVQNAGAFADIEKNLRMIQCLRSIALELIAFLAQLEDFQKKLYLKKRFVTRVEYCISLDRIPSDLWSRLVDCEALTAMWRDLGIEHEPGSLAEVAARVPVDTGLLPQQLRLQTIASMDITQVTGTLFAGDNRGALDLAASVLEGQVRAAYMDPPFNTGTDGFAYKDRYMHSTWLSMMSGVAEQTHRVLTEDGTLYAHIDYTEKERLRLMLSDRFSYITEIIWRIGWLSGYKTKAKKFIRNHDTIYQFGKSESPFFNKTYIPYPKDYVRRDGNPPEGQGYPLEDTWNCSEIDSMNSIQIVSFSKEKVGDQSLTQKNENLLKRIILSSSERGDMVLDPFAGSGTTAAVAMKLGRRWVCCEMGDRAMTYVIPRLRRVIAGDPYGISKDDDVVWAGGGGFRYISIESYEDTLNNLQLRRTSAQGNLLNALPQQAKDDYLLNYLLDVETRGSLLSVEDFKKPFDYSLNVAVDSAGAFEPRKIDLVETFNYLIGLRIKHIDAQPQRGFVTVTGTLPSNETCLVLWRDCDVLDYEGISKLCDKLAINPADNEFDVVYINGDHNIPTVLTQTAEEGGATRVLKLRQIEPEFLERMFSVEDI